jgi:hypothetical protein
MTTSLTAALAALALAQAEPTTAAPQAPDTTTPDAPSVAPRARSRGAAAPAPVAGPRILPPFGLLPPGAPVLREGVPVRCLYGPSGTFRAQCDDGARRCLVAPDAMLDAEGRPSGPLERADACVTPAIKEAELAGWEIVPALADVPPGFRRDERQRASQVSFDLGRRLWLGGGWALGGWPWQPGAFVTSGLRLDHPFTWDGARALARVRALEGWTAVNGSAAELGGVAVDFSRAYPHPLLRITTFIGRPRRYDPPLYVGLWAEALRFETLKTRSGARHERTGALSAAVTLDFWRSPDLASFLRLRAGAGYEKVSGRDDGDVVVAALVEGEAALDGDGLLHLRGAAGSEVVTPGGKGPDAPLPDRRWRHQVRAELERILFSVNDQPVSVVLQARGARRTDVPDWPDGWTFEGLAQLRFSLWAPPLRAAPHQEALEQP